MLFLKEIKNICQLQNRFSLLRIDRLLNCPATVNFEKKRRKLMVKMKI